MQRRAQGQKGVWGGVRAPTATDLLLARCGDRRETCSEELCRSPDRSPFSLHSRAGPKGVRGGCWVPPSSPSSQLVATEVATLWGAPCATRVGMRWGCVREHRLGPNGAFRGAVCHRGVRPDLRGCPWGCARGHHLHPAHTHHGAGVAGATARLALEMEPLAVSTRGTRLLKQRTFAEALQKGFLLASRVRSAAARAGCGLGQGTALPGRRTSPPMGSPSSGELGHRSGSITQEIARALLSLY